MGAARREGPVDALLEVVEGVAVRGKVFVEEGQGGFDDVEEVAAFLVEGFLDDAFAEAQLGGVDAGGGEVVEGGDLELVAELDVVGEVLGDLGLEQGFAVGRCVQRGVLQVGTQGQT